MPMSPPLSDTRVRAGKVVCASLRLSLGALLLDCVKSTHDPFQYDWVLQLDTPQVPHILVDFLLSTSFFHNAIVS